jgi:hypothetical protein
MMNRVAVHERELAADSGPSGRRFSSFVQKSGHANRVIHRPHVPPIDRSLEPNDLPERLGWVGFDSRAALAAIVRQHV